MSALLLEASDAHQVHCPTLAANPSRLLTVLRPVASGFPPDDDELEFEQDDGEPQQDDDEPAAEQDPSVRSTPPLVFEPPRPYGAAFYECDVNVTTCADMHLHHWKTAPRGERITHLKLWGHGLQPKDVDPAQVLQVYFYAFWSDNTYTVEPRSTLLKCYRAKKLAEIQAKTCNAARTAVVGARAGVAGFVVGGCCCGGSGSADRCSGSCLLAGTSGPCSLRETMVSSSSLPVQRTAAGPTPASAPRVLGCCCWRLLLFPVGGRGQVYWIVLARGHVHSLFVEGDHGLLFFSSCAAANRRARRDACAQGNSCVSRGARVCTCVCVAQPQIHHNNRSPAPVPAPPAREEGPDVAYA